MHGRETHYNSRASSTTQKVARQPNTRILEIYGRYPNEKQTLKEVTDTLLMENKVHELSEAISLFKLGRYGQCADLCYDIVRAKPNEAEPSEAILAEAHQYLAYDGVGPDYGSGRAYHAAMAVKAWERVIDRTGTSRYSVEKARTGLELAKRLLHAAEMAADEEDEGL